MSDNSNHIKTFTAEDIRNYWSGKMSAREMHALEKASLDDPFLADALEGYSSVNSQTAASDIDWLRKNLNVAEKEEKKVVPLFKQSWTRVAAAMIIIGGLGTLSYFVFSPEKNKEVAQTKTATEKQQASQLKGDTVVVSSKDTSPTLLNKQTEQIATDAKSTYQQRSVAKLDVKQLNTMPPSALEHKKLSFSSADEVAVAPAVSDSVMLAKIFSDSDDYKKEKASAITAMLSGKVAGLKMEEQPRVAASQNFSLNNNISGWITNNKNEPVVGAVVKANNFNNVAVSDKNGFFSLPVPETIKSDSISVNSIGYMNANVALNANTQNNIKLDENTTALNDVVVVGYGSKKKSVARARAAAVSPVDTLQPAPEDGWEDYYNYVQRNTQSFPDIDGEIVVRFDIDKKGKPNNIVVEKSLTDAADKEAIRIIKEGPGWKANSKKKKVRLTIKF